MKKFYLKVKKLRPEGKINHPAKKGDAGYDVCSTENKFLGPGERYTMPLGLAIEIPDGYVCIVNQKSGLSKNLGIDTMGNVIDSSYRGEIHVTLLNTSNQKIYIEKGQKICQLIFFPFQKAEIQYVDILSDSDRGSDGFGSTGK